jgi:hypothetical protein
MRTGEGIQKAGQDELEKKEKPQRSERERG